MSRRRDEDFSITPLPREKRAAKIQRYMIALTFAAVIAAALVVLASILGLAIAPLFERDMGPVPEQTEQPPQQTNSYSAAGT